MKEKKHIDSLFKELFENFEATPPAHIWDNIQEKLEEKEDRKVIPLWLKIGGIAAMLAVLFSLGNFVFSPNTTNPGPSITNTKNKTEKTIPTTKINEQNIVISEENTIASEDKSVPVSSEKTTTDTVLTTATNTNNKEITDVQQQKNITSTNHKAIASSKNDKNNNNKSLIIEEEKADVIEKKTAITSETTILSKGNTDKNNNKEIKVTKDNKKSIFDAISESSEDALAKLKKENKPDNRWQVTPNIAPVYYNTLSEGSSIDPSFSDNPKSGEITLSYGVQVSYNINKRLSVRSGVSNVNVAYSTTDLELSTGPIAAATKSIDYQGREIVIIPLDKGTLENADPDGGFGNLTPKFTSGEVSLNQSIRYFEVPLELKYTLLDKKIGINLIGGFSTLILGTNEVYVSADNFNDLLGEANNLSSLSFTTNIGFGLNYSFSKKLMINVEPMFKYQLNPYSDSSIDFKPYFLGVYSGLSYQF